MAKKSPKSTSQWVPTREIAALLGCSVDHLFNLRSDDFLKQGTHWLDISRPGAARPTYRWHLRNCSKALSIPPEQR